MSQKTIKIDDIFKRIERFAISLLQNHFLLSKTKNPLVKREFFVRDGEQGSRTSSAFKRIVRVSVAGATVARYSPVTAAILLYQSISIKQKHPHNFVKMFLSVRFCERSSTD